MATALFIIDVQNDFTEGGALGVDGGAALAGRISRFVREAGDRYAVVLASRDWHDASSHNGGHFAVDDEPDFVETWPEHCVAGTVGAEYHPDLHLHERTVHVRKGQGAPAYSIYEGTADDEGRADGGTADDEGSADEGIGVSELLDRHGVDEVHITGIATDYCVRASALDALDDGRRVAVLVDLVAGVAPHTSAATLAELQQAGAQLTTTADVTRGQSAA